MITLVVLNDIFRFVVLRRHRHNNSFKNSNYVHCDDVITHKRKDSQKMVIIKVPLNENMFEHDGQRVCALFHCSSQISFMLRDVITSHVTVQLTAILHSGIV